MKYLAPSSASVYTGSKNREPVTRCLDPSDTRIPENSKSNKKPLLFTQYRLLTLVLNTVKFSTAVLVLFSLLISCLFNFPTILPLKNAVSLSYSLVVKVWFSIYLLLSIRIAVKDDLYTRRTRLWFVHVIRYCAIHRTLYCT